MTSCVAYAPRRGFVLCPVAAVGVSSPLLSSLLGKFPFLFPSCCATPLVYDLLFTFCIHVSHSHIALSIGSPACTRVCFVIELAWMSDHHLAYTVFCLVRLIDEGLAFSSFHYRVTCTGYTIIYHLYQSHFLYRH